MSIPLLAPEPRLTLDGDAVAAIERWAALQRTDLARLALALRSAEAAAARCESEVAERSDGPPDDVLRVVDARLAKARQQAEDGVEAARCDAALVLSASRQHAATILTEAGIDPTTVLDVHQDESSPAPSRRLPVTAAQLWQQADLPAPTRDTTMHPAGAGSVGASPASVVGRDPAPGSTVEVDGEAGVGDAAQVYELFWGGTSGERPVRERLRRRSERGER